TLERNRSSYLAATAACVYVDVETVVAVRELRLMGDDARGGSRRIGEVSLPREGAVLGDVLQGQLRDLGSRRPEHDAYVLLARALRREGRRDEPAKGEERDRRDTAPSRQRRAGLALAQLRLRFCSGGGRRRPVRLA